MKDYKYYRPGNGNNKIMQILFPNYLLKSMQNIALGG